MTRIRTLSYLTLGVCSFLLAGCDEEPAPVVDNQPSIEELNAQLGGMGNSASQAAPPAPSGLSVTVAGSAPTGTTPVRNAAPAPASTGMSMPGAMPTGGTSVPTASTATGAMAPTAATSPTMGSDKKKQGSDKKP